MSNTEPKYNDKISLIKDNIKLQDIQLEKLEQGIDKLEYASENIKNELVDQNNMMNNLQTDINEKKDNINIKFEFAMKNLISNFRVIFFK